MSTIERPTSTELRSSLTEQADKLRELRSTPEDQRSDSYAADLRSAASTVTALDAEFDAVRSAERHELEQAAWDAAVAAGDSRGPAAAFEQTGGSRQDIATRAATHADYREWKDSGGDIRSFPNIELRGSLASPEFRTLLDSTADGSGSDAGDLLPVGQPIAPVAREQRFFLRDVIPVVETTLSSVPYVRELNPATNETGATAVSEGAAKPEVTMAFVDADAPIRKIAAWVPVTMEILQDAPLLRGYINSRLAYMIQVREQAQILSGDGTAPDIEGIQVVTGTQTQAAVADDPWAAIGLAMGKVENVDGMANGVAMNPLDYWLGVVERHANQFDGAAQANAPIGAPAPTVWGAPVIRTRALAQNSVIVADWNGAMIFDRMTTTIRTSDSHSDYFVKNKLAVLAEERIGLAIFRPDLFVKTTISFT